MHVLKSLRAQLIALHYMNGFCPNFSRRLLKPEQSCPQLFPALARFQTSHLKLTPGWASQHYSKCVTSVISDDVEQQQEVDMVGLTLYDSSMGMG